MLKPSPDPAFPQLYRENPTSRTSFITIPNIIIFFPNPYPCQLWRNPVSRGAVNPVSHTVFWSNPEPSDRDWHPFRSFSTLRRRPNVYTRRPDVKIKMCLKLSQWLLTGYYIFHNIVVLLMYIKLNIPCSHVDQLIAIDIWNKQWNDNAGQTF